MKMKSKRKHGNSRLDNEFKGIQFDNLRQVDSEEIDYDVLLESEEEEEEENENFEEYHRKKRRLQEMKNNNNKNGETEIIDEEEEDDDEIGAQEATNQGPRSFVEAFAERGKVVQALKVEYASLGTQIMGYPMRNLAKLKHLVEMLDVPKSDPKYGPAFFTLQKLTFQTLSLIFNDIIPNYKLSEKAVTASGSAPRLKNKTEETLNYERRLVSIYEIYIQRIQRLVLTALGVEKGSNFYRVMLTTREARFRLATIACHCLGNLLMAHFNFNHRDTVIGLLARVLASNQASGQMKKIAFEAFRGLFAKDHRGEATAVAVKQITSGITRQNYCVLPIVFDTLLHLKLTVLESDVGGSDKARKREEMRKMSKKERKRAKKMAVLERQLREADATESAETRHESEAEVHRVLYAFYAHYVDHLQEHLLTNTLDLERWHRPLFGTSLRAIVHLALNSNENFSLYLIERLSRLIKLPRSPLQAIDKLHFLRAIFDALSCIHNSNDLDFQSHYRVLYELCSDLDLWSRSFPVVIECVQAMIVKRAKDVPRVRLVNFLLRFASMALYLSPPASVSLLTVIKRILQANPRLDSIFEDCEDDGDHPLTHLPVPPSDPDQSTTLRESDLLYILRALADRNYHQYTRYLAMVVSRRVHANDQVRLMKQYNLDMDLCQTLVKAADPGEVYRTMQSVCFKQKLFDS